jgi:transposase InsO family protein
VVCRLTRRALVVVELYGRKILALQAVLGERAKAAIALLETLIAKHGAPLVLKLDNGSAFIARCFAEFCRRNGITLLHSPVCTPSFNGTCEVSCRWAKDRAEGAAAARGSRDLCQADLDCAVTFAGDMPRIDDALRQHFLATVARQRAAVALEQGVALDGQLQEHVRRSLERVAVRRALELCHILTVKGREYHQWLPASAA